MLTLILMLLMLVHPSPPASQHRLLLQQLRLKFYCLAVMVDGGISLPADVDDDPETVTDGGRLELPPDDEGLSLHDLMVSGS